MTFFIVLYMVSSIIYFAYWYAKNRQEGIFRLSMIIFLPILGYLLFFLLWLKNKYSRGQNEAAYELGEAWESLVPGKPTKCYDEKSILDLVPIEEALLLNDNGIKRAMLLDMLKGDMHKYPFILKAALVNEDTETSHYAAAGIVEVKRKLQQYLQECKQKYEASKDKNALISYAYALRAYQNCGLLDEANEKKTMAVYKDILRELLEFYSGEEVFFTDLISYEIEAGDLDTAGTYCKKFIDECKQSEKPYLMYLKLFYSSHDRKSFNDMLQILEGSTVCLSYNAWNIINFWKGALS